MMQQNLFTFASLRGAQKPDGAGASLHYIQDDVAVNYSEEAKRVKRSFAPPAAELPMGTHYEEPALKASQLIFKRIFCDPFPAESIEGATNMLVTEFFSRFVPRVDISCDGNTDISFFDEYPWQTDDDTPSFRIIDNKPQGDHLSRKLLKVYAYFEQMTRQASSAALTDDDRKKIAEDLFGILGLDKGQSVVDFVFSENGYTISFASLKEQYFEQLYILYVLRRRQTVDMEPVIQVLRAIHLLDMFAEDYGVLYGHPVQRTQTMLRLLAESHPSPVLQTVKDIATIVEKAVPVIHPLFALLFHVRKPFNQLQPIGVADLKVVKSKLVGYQPFEISHIQNVMKGELNEYTFRELNKTEETFSLNTETSSTSQKENQTTDKNELKREIDEVLKTNLDVDASTSVSLKYGIITDATVKAGMAYTSSTEDSIKSSSVFAAEILNKALDKIETKTTQQRSTAKTFETENTSKHVFDNVGDTNQHISGIYRWVDKVYEAQVYNYGKRLMYEFIIPEPASFFVKSRLGNYEMFGMNCPEKPDDPVYKEVAVLHPSGDGSLLMPGAITEPVFQELSLKYDLEGLFYPAANKKVLLIDKLTGKGAFAQAYGQQKDGQSVTDHYDVELADTGYNMVKMETYGKVRFWDQVAEADILAEQNECVIYINGTRVSFPMPRGTGVMLELVQSMAKVKEFTGAEKIDLTNGKISIDFQFNDIDYYAINIMATLELSPAYLYSWQQQVYHKIKAEEQVRIDQENDEIRMGYNAAMSDYRNKLAAFEATTINDLLQGKQESYNAEVIGTELKKSCICFLTKEFDSDDSTDILSRTAYAAVAETEEKTITYPKFKHQDGACGLDAEKIKVKYPVINLANAKLRGSFIQFIEQAFEWNQLSYIFYPYFWADQPKWIEYMNREDHTDPKMTAFLRAGSARVLVSVHPSYNNAVLHFLATGQVWEGGSTPVIGDPLFIPLFEEIRDAQDDIQDAKPEGKPYRYQVGTQLVYLQDSTSQLPEDFD